MVDTAVMRERLFTMRMSEEEHARLDGVSKHYGLNAAGTIRMLVKREHDALGEARPAKAATTKKKPKR
jgi:hypothetical protein